MDEYFILYDGEIEWVNLLPITFTKTISDIRIGILTIKERWEKYIGGKSIIYTKNFLSKKYTCKKQLNIKNVLMINSSFLPNEKLIELLLKLKENEAIFYSTILVATRIHINNYENYENIIKFVKNHKQYKKIYSFNQIIYIQNIWDLFINNDKVLRQDFDFLTKDKKSCSLFGPNYLIDKKNIFFEENVYSYNVILNAKIGPIYIEKGVNLMEGSMIRGPAAICRNSLLNMGTKIYGATTIGPQCKVGGEIRNSIFLSYSNKAHDGFIGDSIIGEWCNIGAGTNVSNLRNDYSNVKVWSYDKKKFIRIPIQFFGMIMGDYSKSSINTQFNTATIVGVGANIFGIGFPPKYISSFSFGSNNNQKISFYQVCQTAKIMMKRRNICFSFIDKNILKYLYDYT
ncbi:putative sugar nucleotidyl transferase [Blattabacterium cuenoti]|uniref:putative sugar nucleotidyl transferase n=1 Tax=Blattabacterium cuenoti TaxID=1653831 RepID=UPI00163BA9A4|nr:putative sugar nucleotidyl transferase [Blattabacterium cuenoti]